MFWLLYKVGNSIVVFFIVLLLLRVRYRRRCKSGDMRLKVLEGCVYIGFDLNLLRFRLENVNFLVLNFWIFIFMNRFLL